MTWRKFMNHLPRLVFTSYPTYNLMHVGGKKTSVAFRQDSSNSSVHPTRRICRKKLVKKWIENTRVSNDESGLTRVRKASPAIAIYSIGICTPLGFKSESSKCCRIDTEWCRMKAVKVTKGVKIYKFWSFLVLKTGVSNLCVLFRYPKGSKKNLGCARAARNRKSRSVNLRRRLIVSQQRSSHLHLISRTRFVEEEEALGSG